MAITEIKNGHKYTLSMSSASDLTFNGLIEIVFSLPLPSYNGSNLRNIHQELSIISTDTEIYYDDLFTTDNSFTYPLSLTFGVNSFSGNLAEINNYITEEYCGLTVIGLGVTYDSVNVPYGEDTEIQFYANDGYALPSSVSVTNATYSWDKETGILTIQPNSISVSSINVNIIGDLYYSVTSSTSSASLSNKTNQILSGETYTSKVNFQAGYIISDVTVTMGGVEQTGVYDATTSTITVPNVSGDLVITITTAEDDTGLKMYLFENSAENNRVDKTDYISQVDVITGTFRTTVSVTNPIIVIEYATLPTFNYVYINQLHRYYFVTDVISISKNQWELNLMVDVLMTYKEKIYQQIAFIERQENEYNEYLIDDERLSTNNTITSYEEISSFFDEDSDNLTPMLIISTFSGV